MLVLAPISWTLIQLFIFQALCADFDTSNIPSGASTAFIKSRSSWLSVACPKTTSTRKYYVFPASAASSAAALKFCLDFRLDCQSMQT
jgi:hypothetical protein